MRVLLVLFSLLFLAGCSDEAQQVVDGITKSCGVVVQYDDIVKVIAAAGSTVNAPAGAAAATVNGIVQSVCEQWNTKHGTASALADDGCVATVNGVCVRKK